MSEITTRFAFYDLARLGHSGIKSTKTVKDLSLDGNVFPAVFLSRDLLRSFLFHLWNSPFEI